MEKIVVGVDQPAALVNEGIFGDAVVAQTVGERGVEVEGRAESAEAHFHVVRLGALHVRIAVGHRFLAVLSHIGRE